MGIYCSTEQLTLIFIDWILSHVMLRVLYVLHHFLFIILPSSGCCFSLLALFVNYLMVRVKKFFSPFVHILLPTVLEDLLVCPLPMILLGITIWLFLDLSSHWTDFCAAGMCLLFRLGAPYLLLCWLMSPNGVMLWRPYNIISLQLATIYYCSICLFCFSVIMKMKHCHKKKKLVMMIWVLKFSTIRKAKWNAVLN